MMRARGKPFRNVHRKTSLTESDSDTPFHPFPVASISTVLLVILLLSTLSALYTGVHRDHRAVVVRDYSSIPASGTAVDDKVNGNDGPATNNESNGNNEGPSIRSFKDLSASELHPQAGPHRHIVSPPPDETPVTLVSCSTTAGYLHVLVHPSWAPLGAKRFLQMVNSKHFSTKVVSVFDFDFTVYRYTSKMSHLFLI